MRCPHCGASQEESIRVLSTICRACGHYFKVESAPAKGGLFDFSNLFRRKKAETRGYLKPCIGLTNEPRERPAIREARVEPFDGEEEYDPVPRRRSPLDEVAAEGSEDQMASIAGEAGGFVHEDDEDDDEELGGGYEMVEVEPVQSWPGSREDALKRSLISTFPERTTECFDCGSTLHFSAKASSTICNRCSAYIGLQDVEVREHVREGVKMRGDLTIHRKASLSAMEIACETLRVYGKITGKIDCHGDAFFRSSGKVVGSVRCRHLFVHKASDLTFVPGIRAETAEIHGRMVGDLICEGTIRISKTGMVLGDCIAPAIELESGGILEGQMRIAEPDQELREDYERKAEAARCEFLMRGIEEFEDQARGRDRDREV